MKKINKFLVALAIGVFGLTSCSLLNFGNNESTNQNSSLKEEINDFDFIKDESLTWDDNEFYLLKVMPGTSYQIKTDVDDKLGNNYELKYSVDKEVSGLTVSESGLVTVMENLEQSISQAIYAKLYKKGSDKVIKKHYVILSSAKGNNEYAEASMSDTSLEYDANSKTYFKNINAGQSFQIALSTKTNTTFKTVYSLTNNSYSEFMSISENGTVTTVSNISENKIGKVKIDLVSTKNNKVLYTLYLQVNIKASTTPVNTDKLTVSDIHNGASITEGSTVEVFIGETLELDVKFNNQTVSNALSSSSDSIRIENNVITPLKAGEANVTAAYGDKTLSFRVIVKANPVTGLYAIEGGSSFIIHNGKLHMLYKVYVTYQNGYQKEIRSLDELAYTISDNNAIYKTVNFTYSEGGQTVSMTLQVKFFNSEEYDGEETAYNFLDFGKKSMYGEYHYLPNQNELKFLVIPTWFKDSTNFFTDAQKAQIKEDITAKILEDKNDVNYWSVKSFYERESFGKLNVSATVTDFYSSDTYLTNYTDAAGETGNTYTLVNNATKWYFDNNPSDPISNYDKDNDGKVDGVILYYAGNYYGAKNATMRTVAYAWANASNSRNYNTACFCPVGGIYGFTKSSNTQTQLNASDLSKLNPGSFTRGSNHVIHEVGHMFGNEDLYEYATANQTKYYPCGSFSMQDNNSGSHDPFHTNMIGWTKPDIYASKDYNVGDKITISVDDFQSSGNNIILSRDYNEYNSLFDEYLILELFTPTGLNEYDARRLNVQNVGFRVWHVDATLTDYHQDSQNLINNCDFKNSTYNRDSEFDLVHLIRNDSSVGINVDTTFNGGDLFSEGDYFNMETYSKQFVKGARLDNEERLGWEVNFDKIYYDMSAKKYTGILTLTRVDSTRRQFRATANMSDNVTQPSGNTNEIGQVVLNDTNITMNYAFNDSTVYSTNKAISVKGIRLFAGTGGNGGSLEISIKDKNNYNCYINSIKLVYCCLTSATLKATVNGNEIESTRFDGPVCAEGATDNQGNPVNDYGRLYQVNAKTVKLQNTLNGTINHYSFITIVSMEIEYTITPNN